MLGISQLAEIKLGLKPRSLGSKSGGPSINQIISTSVPWIVPWGLPSTIALRKDRPAPETQQSENGGPIQLETRDFCKAVGGKVGRRWTRLTDIPKSQS